MTKHIAPLPDRDGSLLLRELNHRVNNELTSTICTISAKAVESDDVAVKAALLDVVELLHGSADVHKALGMPDPGHLIFAVISSIFASPSPNTDWTAEYTFLVFGG